MAHLIVMTDGAKNSAARSVYRSPRSVKSTVSGAHQEMCARWTLRR
jgi:hypothetical protein